MEQNDTGNQKLQEYEGTVENITFATDSGDYVVARFLPEGEREKIVIVGSMVSLRPGEHLRISGTWVKHKKFGNQFKVERYQVLVPTSRAGLIKYLGSGLIRGIGPVFAKRIVDKFGTDALDILENSIERLREVPGIGKKTLEKVVSDWKRHVERRETLIFLEGHGLGPGLATRIIDAYGSGAISVIKSNPYRLATDISGIGFKTADKVAASLGFAPDSPERVEAGVLFTLQEMRDDGHSCCPYEELVPKAVALLDVSHDKVETAVESVEEQKFIVIDDDIGERPVYLRNMYVDETSVAELLLRISRAKSPLQISDVDAAIQWAQERRNVELAESQANAMRRVLQSKLSVITGGPGVGKTTLINCIIPVLRAKKMRIALAAPTGRAAKRLSEAASWDASTIHRMLKYNPRDHQFSFNEENPLPADAIIVDEASMIDITLMHHLLRALRDDVILVLVGDVDQLPPVGPGDVLREIIYSGVAAVSYLEEIFRQAGRSMIVANAHRVNHGEMPLIKPVPDMLRDFFFMLPAKFGFEPTQDIQVLTPMHKGVVGASNLNAILQNCLNPLKPNAPAVQRGARQFRVNDKVMQIANNYDKDVFNGDIGRVAEINRIDQFVVVRFENRPVEYDFDELGQLVHAYAISVHKSQGSEYPVVVMPVVTQHYIMLQRNLLYTGVTRGKRLVVLIGTMKAVARAVRNNAIQLRHTHLRDRLRKHLAAD